MTIAEGILCACALSSGVCGVYALHFFERGHMFMRLRSYYPTYSDERGYCLGEQRRYENLERRAVNATGLLVFIVVVVALRHM